MVISSFGAWEYNQELHKTSLFQELFRTIFSRENYIIRSQEVFSSKEIFFLVKIYEYSETSFVQLKYS